MTQVYSWHVTLRHASEAGIRSEDDFASETLMGLKAGKLIVIRGGKYLMETTSRRLEADRQHWIARNLVNLQSCNSQRKQCLHEWVYKAWVTATVGND